MNTQKIRTSNAAAALWIASLAAQLFFLIVPFFGGRWVWNFYTIVSLLLNAALCAVLFSKKRDIVLAAVLAGTAAWELIFLFRYFTVFGLFEVIAYALLAVLALAVCEQTVVKADLSKVKDIAGKLFFVPAVLCLASFLLAIPKQLEIYGMDMGFVSLRFFMHLFARSMIVTVLESLAMLSLAMWLKDPAENEAETPTAAATPTAPVAAAAPTQEEAYCSLGKHIVLCLFTFGIWYMIWIYRTTKYLNNTPDAEQYNPTNKLLLCLFVPFYQIYWLYKHGQRIDTMSKAKNLNNADMATLCLILGIFVPIVACILMQDRINTLCTAPTAAAPVAPVATAAPVAPAAPSVGEQLKEYKDLLDSGVITQEDFDAKKKQLLGL